MGRWQGPLCGVKATRSASAQCLAVTSDEVTPYQRAIRRDAHIFVQSTTFAERVTTSANSDSPSPEICLRGSVLTKSKPPAMPNQLSVPFKKTYAVPLREAVREYILTHYTDTHPDAYRWDISHWEKLRAELVSNTVHIDRANSLIRYDFHTSISTGSLASSSCSEAIMHSLCSSLPSSHPT